MSSPAENTQAQPATEQKPNDKEYNFSQLRKQLDQERQARLQTEARLAQIEQERQQQQPRQDDSDDDDSEPYVDQKRLKKTLAKQKEELTKEFKQAVRQEASQLIEQERQTSFLRQNNDFNQILTPELIQKFAEAHPEIAEPMLEMPDNFARQKLLYQNIKALGLHKPPAPKEDIQKKVDANRRSPYYQPSSVSGAPPYANNGDFSPTGQKNAYQKMKELINNRRAL